MSTTSWLRAVRKQVLGRIQGRPLWRGLALALLLALPLGPTGGAARATGSAAAQRVIMGGDNDSLVFGPFDDERQNSGPLQRAAAGATVAGLAASRRFACDHKAHRRGCRES